MKIFDTNLLAQRAGRSEPNALAWQRLAEALQIRLREIKRDLPCVAEIAPHLKVFDAALCTEKHVAERGFILPFALQEEILPLPPASLDAIVSWGHLHFTNDLPGFLIQCRRALKPDGVFLGALFGGETLFELRQALAVAEAEICGGISPRVSPFASLPDMATLMQRAQFALPVVDHDIVTVTYPDLRSLIGDLRTMGQTNAIMQRDKKYTGRKFWQTVEDHYRAQFSEQGRLLATVEIISLIGWSPHDSQQQPLRRGTATHRLADILQADEHGGGEFV